MTKDKRDPKDKPKTSRYAQKKRERKRLAKKLGLRTNATWPEIWAVQEA